MNMMPIFEFSRSAYKHGISDSDILWAFDNFTYDGLIERGASASEDKYLLVGYDINAHPLEIMYNIIDDGVFRVFHAMKCRNIYIHLLNTDRKE
jgi:hypothetical protein